MLYLRIDFQKQHIINKRIDDDVVLNIGKKNKIIGIEIMNASEKVNLSEIIPLNIKERKIIIAGMAELVDLQVLNIRKDALILNQVKCSVQNDIVDKI